MKKKILIVLCIISVLLIATGCVFYYLNAQEEKRNKIMNTTTEKFEDNINDINNYLGYTLPFDDISKVDVQDIMFFGYLNMDVDTKYKSFTKEDLRETIDKYFGADYKYEDADIKSPDGNGIVYKYSDGTYTRDMNNKYIENFARSRYYIVDRQYDSKTDVVSIKAKVLYADFADDYYGPVCRYYSSYTDSQKRENILYTDPEPNEDIEIYDEVYKKVKDKLITYSYNFVKDSKGNYIIKNITKE